MKGNYICGQDCSTCKYCIDHKEEVDFVECVNEEVNQWEYEMLYKGGQNRVVYCNEYKERKI